MVAKKEEPITGGKAWQKLAQSAFKKILEIEFSQEIQRESGGSDRRRFMIVDERAKLSLEETPQLGTSSQDTVVEEKLQLPWMPKSSIVPKLVAALGLARAIDSHERLHEICAPSNLIELSIRSNGIEIEKLQRLLQSLLKYWSTPAHKRFEADSVDVCCPPNATESNTRIAARNLASFVSEIEEKIREGKTVFVITNDLAAISPVLAELRQHTLSIPSLDQAGLIEIIRVLRSDAKAISAKALMRLLPPDAVLKSLSVTMIESALRQRDLPSVLERLKALAEPSRRLAEITLEHVHGQDEAVSIFHRMIADLQRWKTGEIEWNEAGMSAVMHGPPGNGKTLLAAAVAGSAGVPLVATSYADCQRHGHQGDMLRELNAAFDRAFQLAPSVLFIDEIDNFSDRSSGDSEYLRGVVNGLLTLLSRATGTPGVILLAATNHLSAIDPAVIRPGRFDLKIPVRNATIEGIERILIGHLKVHPRNDADHAHLSQATRAMLGASGAEVAAKAREALAISRGLGRPFEWSDLSVTLRDKQPRQSQDTIRRIAVHEAGHIIVNALTSLPPIQRVHVSSQHSALELDQVTLLTAETANELLKVLMAGRAAEKVCFGDVSTASGHGLDSDLARATLIALKMETEWCLDTPVLPWTKAEIFMTMGLPSDLRQRVSKRLAKAEREAVEGLIEHQKALEQLAGVLLERRELLETDIHQVLQTLDLEKRYGAAREHRRPTSGPTRH